MANQVAASISTHSSTIPFNAASQRAVFQLSDGALLAAWATGTSFTYALSTNGGTTWGTPTTFGANYSGSSNYQGITLCKDPASDTLYGVGYGSANGTGLTPYKFAYAAGVVTVTAGTKVASANDQMPNGYATSAVAWDSDHHHFHFTNRINDGTLAAGCYAWSWDTTLTLKAGPTLLQATTRGVSIYVPGGADGANTNGTLWWFSEGVVTPWTYNGTTYTTGSGTTLRASEVAQYGACGGLDPTTGFPYFLWCSSAVANLDLSFAVYNGASWARTSIVGTQAAALRHGVTVNVDSDVWAYYTSFATQANGEVWVIKRLGGTWNAPALVAGGDAGGYQYPTCPVSLPKTGITGGTIVPVLWEQGTAGPWGAYEVGTSIVPTTTVASTTSTTPLARGGAHTLWRDSVSGTLVVIDADSGNLVSRAGTTASAIAAATPAVLQTGNIQSAQGLAITEGGYAAWSDQAAVSVTHTALYASGAWTGGNAGSLPTGAVFSGTQNTSGGTTYYHIAACVPAATTITTWVTTAPGNAPTQMGTATLAASLALAASDPAISVACWNGKVLLAALTATGTLQTGAMDALTATSAGVNATLSDLGVTGLRTSENMSLCNDQANGIGSAWLVYNNGTGLVVRWAAATGAQPTWSSEVSIPGTAGADFSPVLLRTGDLQNALYLYWIDGGAGNFVKYCRFYVSAGAVTVGAVSIATNVSAVRKYLSCQLVESTTGAFVCQEG